MDTTYNDHYGGVCRMFKNNRMDMMRRRGVSTIEYGILAALIGVSAIGATTVLGSNTSGLMCTIKGEISSTPSTSSCGSNNTTSSTVYSPTTTEHINATSATMMMQLLTSLANNRVSQMSGMYNASGQAITTPDDLLTNMGLDSSIYDNYAVAEDRYNNDAIASENPSTRPSDAELEAASDEMQESMSALENQLSNAGSVTSSSDVYIPNSAALSYTMDGWSNSATTASSLAQQTLAFLSKGTDNS